MKAKEKETKEEKEEEKQVRLTESCMRRRPFKWSRMSWEI